MPVLASEGLAASLLMGPASVPGYNAAIKTLVTQRKYSEALVKIKLSLSVSKAVVQKALLNPSDPTDAVVLVRETPSFIAPEQDLELITQSKHIERLDSLIAIASSLQDLSPENPTVASRLTQLQLMAFKYGAILNDLTDAAFALSQPVFGPLAAGEERSQERKDWEGAVKDARDRQLGHRESNMNIDLASMDKLILEIQQQQQLLAFGAVEDGLLVKHLLSANENKNLNYYVAKITEFAGTTKKIAKVKKDIVERLDKQLVILHKFINVITDPAEKGLYEAAVANITGQIESVKTNPFTDNSLIDVVRNINQAVGKVGDSFRELDPAARQSRLTEATSLVEQAATAFTRSNSAPDLGGAALVPAGQSPVRRGSMFDHPSQVVPITSGVAALARELAGPLGAPAPSAPQTVPAGEELSEIAKRTNESILARIDTPVRKQIEAAQGTLATSPLTLQLLKEATKSLTAAFTQHTKATKAYSRLGGDTSAVQACKTTFDNICLNADTLTPNIRVQALTTLCTAFTTAHSEVVAAQTAILGQAQRQDHTPTGQVAVGQDMGMGG